MPFLCNVRVKTWKKIKRKRYLVERERKEHEKKITWCPDVAHLRLVAVV